MLFGGIHLMREEEVVSLVKKNYKIDVFSAEKIKNVYKLQSSAGEYCLKVVHYEYGHFLFILEAIKHLINKGFINVPKIISTISGKEYINFDNYYAYVTKWVTDNRECNYDNPIDIIFATSTLAKLHKKSEDFIVTKAMNPRNYWFKWTENFSTRKNEILDFQNRINHKEIKTEFDCKYMELIPKEVRRAEMAVEHLKSTKYIEKMKEEMKKNGYCHHDYAHHNVLIGKNCEVTIIDFDYCILDTHLHDVASLLIRKMKNGKWDLYNAEYILDVYNSIYKIESSDIPILSAFMEFPQDFWQLGIQYYLEKQPWEEQFFINKLNKIALDINGKQEFIEIFRRLKFRG